MPGDMVEPLLDLNSSYSDLPLDVSQAFEGVLLLAELRVVLLSQLILLESGFNTQESESEFSVGDHLVLEVSLKDSGRRLDAVHGCGDLFIDPLDLCLDFSKVFEGEVGAGGKLYGL